MDALKRVAMTARMEGESVVVRNIGKKRKVSEMELVALCNLAEFGLLSAFSELDGESGELAARERDRLKKTIHQAFSVDGCDGFNKLSQACVAILRTPRFEKYIFRDDDLNE